MRKPQRKRWERSSHRLRTDMVLARVSAKRPAALRWRRWGVSLPMSLRGQFPVPPCTKVPCDCPSLCMECSGSQPKLRVRQRRYCLKAIPQNPRGSVFCLHDRVVASRKKRYADYELPSLTYHLGKICRGDHEDEIISIAWAPHQRRGECLHRLSTFFRTKWAPEPSIGRLTADSCQV